MQYVQMQTRILALMCLCIRVQNGCVHVYIYICVCACMRTCSYASITQNITILADQQCYPRGALCITIILAFTTVDACVHTKNIFMYIFDSCSLFENGISKGVKVLCQKGMLICMQSKTICEQFELWCKLS